MFYGFCYPLIQQLEINLEEIFFQNIQETFSDSSETI